MLDAALTVAAVGVALVYFTIAALVVPKISLGAANRRFIYAVRAGATLFFVGCGLTHLHIAAHSLSTPATPHELGFHVVQLIGGWVFVIASLRYLTIRVEPRERESQLRRLEELEQLAVRDPLTGAYNRRYYDEALSAEVERHRLADEPIAVAHLDIDEFKALNDGGGHALGDEVLRNVRVLADETLRPRDMVIRLGGDEFALLLPKTTRLQALSAAERLRARLGSLPVGEREGINVSIGIAALPEDGSDPKALETAADRALYWVKRHGKNGCALADPDRDGVPQA